MRVLKRLCSILAAAIVLSLVACTSFPKPTTEKNSLLLLVFDRKDNRTNPDTRISWSDVVELSGPENISVKSTSINDRIMAITVKPGQYQFMFRKVTRKNPGGGYDEQSARLGFTVDVPADSIVLAPYRFHLVMTGTGWGWQTFFTIFNQEYDQKKISEELSDTIGFSEWIGKLFIGFGKYPPRMTFRQDEYRIRIVSTPPSADVIVDNEKRGETPMAIDVGAGKHLFEVRKEGFASWRNYVEIDSDQEIAMSLKTSEQLASEGDERAQLKQDQYGLVITPFRNLGGVDSAHLQDVFHEALAATLGQDRRILVYKTPENAPKTDKRDETITPDFSVANDQGADLLVAGDYYARTDDLLIHASLFDVQKESVKADILYSSKTGLSIFDSIDEMTQSFRQAVDNVLPESGKQILERKEVVETEITSLEKKVTQKDIIDRRGKRRHDFTLNAGLEGMLDSIETDNPNSDDQNKMRYSGAGFGVAAGYTLHIVNALGLTLQANYSTSLKNDDESIEQPGDWAFFAGPELTFSGLSLDVYARFLGQFRAARSVEYYADEVPLGETGHFTYYGFSIDTGLKYYLMRHYSSPGWYANLGFRYTPYMIRSGGEPPNDGKEAIPLEIFIYAGFGVRL